MQEYRLRDMFKPSMAELGLCMFQLECMVQEQLPELYMHFQSQGFCVSMFASSWFLTLFTTVLTLPVACRIFDVFLSEGLEIIFRVAFSILEIGYDELMAQDMEGMLKFFQREMPAKHDQDPDFLLNSAYQVKYSARKMKKLEKEYNALKSKEQEEQVELRRLRTENRLLRQRIDNLEKETATLADRLVQDQVVRAQKEEEMFGLKRELAQVRQHDAATSHKLVEANEAIQEYKRSDSAMSTSSSGSHQEETIQQLEEELMQVRLREAESTSLIRELRDKIRELESMNRQLQKEPCQEIQVLQEELIASKLREAEATLSMKELRQKVSDLDKCWQKHLERTNAATQKPPSKTREQSLNEEVMTVRMKEAEAMAELKEMKQKVMELETQNQICNRQIKRMDDENQRIKSKLEDAAERDKETKYHFTEMERKVTDLEGKRKEDTMMCRIKDAEHTQTIAEMRQRIAELEIENQELVTRGQLSEKGECQELENKIADLQEEVMQLKMARKLQSLSSMALNHIALDTESDYDTDDLEATMAEANSNRLQGPEGLDNPMTRSAIRRDFDLDSSEGEGLYNHDGGTVKRRTSKKKRRNLSKGDITKDANGSRGESGKRDSEDEGASGEDSESNTNDVRVSNGATENAQTQLSVAVSPSEKDAVQVNGALYTDDASTTSSSM